MRRESIAQPIIAGVIASITGFASSFVIVIAGLRAVGASPDQAASGLLILSVVQGVLAIVFGLVYRLPLVFAWSTPGAALLVAAQSTTGDFSAAVGAFLLCGVLLVVTGLWPALARLMTRIPVPIASAMLAGILLPICLAPVEAVAVYPAAAIPVVLVWLVLQRLAPRWATAGAVVVTAVAVLVLSGGGGAIAEAGLAPTIALTVPSFDPLILVGLGVPLFVVTMAGQNVPGFAVLRTFGYTDLPSRAMLVGTGIGTAVAAPFGGHALNLAAITAAMIAGPDAAEDPRRRWIGAVSGGVTYLLLAPGVGVATALVATSPPVLIEAIAGLALLGTLATALVQALEDPGDRLVAIVTFAVVAMPLVVPVAPFGIGSAFWGLVVGGIVMAGLRLGRRRSAPPPR